MSSQTLWKIYDFTHDKVIGIFSEYDTAECVCDEYTSDWWPENIEVCVYPIDENGEDID